VAGADFKSLINQIEPFRKALPAGIATYLVGGAVRDAVRGVELKDLDFAVAGDALAVGRKVARELRADYFPLDIERQTARVILDRPDGRRIYLDFAALRGESLDDDLRGRDFTINAIAIALDGSWAIIDPLGGINDLHRKMLRVCSEQAMLDDPLRAVRSVRLAVNLELKIIPETARLIRRATPMLQHVSAERVRDELFRILEGQQPASAMRLLDHLGILSHILPEVTALKGVSQPPPHILDAWEHTLHLLDRLDQVLGVLSVEYNQESAANWALGLIALRIGRYRRQIGQHLQTQLNPERSLRGLLFLAGLMHDVGKASTRQLDSEGRVRFFEHEQVGEQAAEERGRSLHLSNVETERVKNIVRQHMRPLLLGQLEYAPTRRAIYRFFRATGEAGVDVCLLSLADMLATYGPTLPRESWMHQLEITRTLLEAWWDHPQQSVAPPPLINGDDIMKAFGLGSGRKVGELLEVVREAQAAGLINEPEQAFDLIRQHLESKSD
jgi:tRNA nucleotidyltransferase/poly(A) polymerase